MATTVYGSPRDRQYRRALEDSTFRGVLQFVLNAGTLPNGSYYAPTELRDKSVPGKVAAWRAQDSVYDGSPTYLLTSPNPYGNNSDWANPKRPLKNTPTDFYDNTLNLLLGTVVQNPFETSDWPLPRRRIESLVNKTYTYDQPLSNLLGQDSMQGAAGEVPDYDYPNPRLKALPLYNRTYIYDQPLNNLLGQDILPNQTKYDWPVPTGKNGYQRNIALKTDQEAKTSFPLNYLQSLSKALPLRGAFFYPWFVGGDPSFPGAWTQGTTPFTQYHPTRGYYNSSDTATIDAQIADLQYAKFDVAISSWWGQGSREDGVLPTLLSRALGTNLKFCAYYEAEGNTVGGVTGSPDPTSAQITSDLNYISANYTNHPNYLRVNGKPVIFAYGGPEDGTQGPTGLPSYRWHAANAAANEDWYYVLKVYSGYASDTFQPPDWHQYGPAAATDQQGTHSYTVSPGFWLASESTPRLARDPVAFGANVASMVAANVNWKLITSYNEWGEGHSVESANGSSGFNYSGSGWDTYARGSYLDILSTDGVILPTLNGFQADQGSYDWSNPLRKAIRKYPDLGDNGLNNLLSFILAGNPFGPFDWFNPIRKNTPLGNKTFLNMGYPFLNGQDVMGRINYDQPLAPKGPKLFFNKLAGLRSEIMGDDQFFGMAGNPSYDWPNPSKGYKRQYFDRTLNDNGLANLLTVFIQSPFMFYDWTVPTGRKVPLENKTFLEVGLPFLIGADTFFGASGQVPSYDWQLPPKGRVFPVENRTWSYDEPLKHLLGLDSMYGGIGQVPTYDWTVPKGRTPIRQDRITNDNGLNALLTVFIQSPFMFYDWTIPAGRKYPTSLRGSTLDLSQFLIGQDVVYGGAGQVPNYDWIVPKGRPQPNKGSQLGLSEFLIGQDQFYGDAGQAPTQAFPNPTPARNRIRQDYSLDPNILLFLPNPVGASALWTPSRVVKGKPDFIKYSRPNEFPVIVVPVTQNRDFPNPLGLTKVRPLFYYVQGNMLLEVTPNRPARVIRFIPNLDNLTNTFGVRKNISRKDDLGTEFNPDDPGY